MARLLWLADVLRAAGLPVAEYDGWRTRGYDPDSNPYGPIKGIICHATAGSTGSSDDAEMRVLWVTGSVTAPAPISQLYLSRTGTWWVGASGRCNHVKLSDVFPTSPLGVVGNDALIGIEAANNNRGEPWPAVQLDSYQRGVAALCRKLGFPAGKALAHREHQYGKTDPYGIDMTRFRTVVAAVLAGTYSPSPQETDMIVLFTDAGQKWRGDGVTRRPISDIDAGALQHIGSTGALKVAVWRNWEEVANPDAFGALDSPSVVTDEQLDTLTAALIAAPDNPLSAADLDAVKATVKQAWREGTG